MTITMTPLDIATAFTKAWTSHDLESARKFVSDDVVFDGPLQLSSGIDAYFKGLSSLSEEVKEMRMIASFGDDHQALLMYDLMTESYGILTCAKQLTIKDGKIRKDRLTFDSYKVRSTIPQ